MQTLLNTLFVTTQGAYLHMEQETLKVDIEGKTQLQVPVHHIGAIVCFGNVLISPHTFHRSAKDGRPITLMDRNGRFGARVEGPLTGNVLLRQAQYEAVKQSELTVDIARAMVAGKLQNSRFCLLRSARDTEDEGDNGVLADAAQYLGRQLQRLPDATALESVRGIEGDGARRYFEVFSNMIRPADREVFRFERRSRRPPLDRINALLSFIYTLLVSDCVAAVQGVGLDHQVGFLHTLRPGRPALALDLAEEFRSVLGDRLILTLINRRQISAEDFEDRQGGAVYLSEQGRKTVLAAYQKRKQQAVTHPVLEQQMQLGLVPHIQARLLARTLRGDVPGYMPYLHR